MSSNPDHLVRRRPAAAHRALSFPIGRVAGIQIRVHVTFFLLVPLFALAGEQSGGPGALGAVGWLFVIFACVVVHEFAHCLVGRPRGLVVHEIELLPIGGVSKLENLPDDPHDELAMAIAGPLASLGIAAGAASLAVLLAEPMLPIDLFGGPLLARIAWFNLIIAGFNLLPAFPLDGGRVFRAFLEERGLTLEQATRIAARAGRSVAIALIVVGVFFDLWLVIIGVFVYFGAAAEEAATIMHVRLHDRVVGDVMLLDPVVVNAAASAAEVRAVHRRSAQRVFPVVGAQGYEGMIDAAALAGAAAATVVSALEHRDIPVVAPADDLEPCVATVVAAPGRAVAVLEGADVVGVLRIEEVEGLLSRPVPQPQRRDGMGGRS